MLTLSVSMYGSRFSEEVSLLLEAPFTPRRVSEAARTAGKEGFLGAAALQSTVRVSVPRFSRLPPLAAVGSSAYAQYVDDKRTRFITVTGKVRPTARPAEGLNPSDIGVKRFRSEEESDEEEEAFYSCGEEEEEEDVEEVFIARSPAPAPGSVPLPHLPFCDVTLSLFALPTADGCAARVAYRSHTFLSAVQVFLPLRRRQRLRPPDQRHVHR